jgi:hypothetical protein
MMNMRSAAVAVAVVAAGIGAFAQGGAEQVTVPFSDPSRPGRLRIGMTQGSIKVSGGNRRDVAIVARPSASGCQGRADGLRRLPQSPAF